MDFSSLLFGFQGRINRAKYWLAVLIYVVAMIIVGAVLALSFWASGSGAIITMFFGLIALIVYIAMIVSGIAVGSKRLHDRDKSAWWLLVFYVLPGVLAWMGVGLGVASGSQAISMLFSLVSFGISIWAFVELGCLRGTVGANGYGPDPVKPGL
jgi:uncharacterized membrane protein YhaH (DUF805 family)